MALPVQLLAKELLIGVNERAIYRTQDSNGFWEGKDISLIKAVFRRTQHSYKIVSMPWTRVLESLKSGSIDMTLAAANLPERREYALFSEHPFRFSHYTLFIDANKANLFNSVTRLEDVIDKNILIGALRGAVYSISFYKLLQNDDFANKLVYIDNDQNMVQFALKGRVDAYIDSEIEGKYYLKQQPGLANRITPLFRITTDEEAKSHLMFSKQSISQSLVAEFDMALKDLHLSNEYQEISKQFGQ